MAKEIDRLVASDKFTVSELPPGRKAISGRWVFDWKFSEHGEVTRGKCRLVARGFLQKNRATISTVTRPHLELPQSVC